MIRTFPSRPCIRRARESPCPPVRSLRQNDAATWRGDGQSPARTNMLGTAALGCSADALTGQGDALLIRAR